MFMERNFSQHVKEILGYSREEAERLQNSNIVPEHLLLGIIRDGANRAVDALVGLGASLRTIKSSLENELSASNNHMEQQSSELTISKSTDRVLKMSMLEARFMKSQETDSEHLLLAILKESDSPAAKILHTNDITYDEVSAFLKGEATGEAEAEQHPSLVVWEPVLPTTMTTNWRMSATIAANNSKAAVAAALRHSAATTIHPCSTTSVPI